MDYRQLQLFLAAAERLNLTHAAEAMNITQPGLSKSLQRLQRDLGAKLYHRRGRGIELTEVGRTLLKHAKLMETQLATVKSEIKGISRGTSGHARIGAGPSWLSRHLPEAIGQIMAKHPGIHFTVDTGFPDKLIGRLRQGELDIVIGALPENRLDPDLRFVRLTSDVIHVVGRKEHPLLRKRVRVLADYAAQLWVLPNRQELVRQRLTSTFRASGLSEPVIAVETESLSLILSILRATDCLGMTTSQILTQSEAHGIVTVDQISLRFKRDSGIISQRYAEPASSVRLVVGELRRIASKQASN